MRYSGNTYQDGTPTPENPIPIQNVIGNVKTKIQNKNLYNKDNDDVGYVYSSTGSYGASAVWTTSDWIKVSSSNQYHLSYKTTNSANLFFSEFDNNKQFIQRTTTSDLTPTTNTKYIRLSYKNDLGTYDIQLEENTTSTSYEEHQEQNYPLNLGSIELCKIGEYKDYIYKDNDKWYVKKLINKVVLDGSESGWQYDTTYNYIRNSIYDFNGLIPANDSNQLSNYFKVEKTWITFRNTTDLNAFIPISNTGYKFAIRNTNCSSLAEYLAFFANYKPEFYYILETPTDIEITNTTLINQLEAMKQATAYNDVTNISGSSDELSPIYKVQYWEKVT